MPYVRLFRRSHVCGRVRVQGIVFVCLYLCGRGCLCVHRGEREREERGGVQYVYKGKGPSKRLMVPNP